jgi:hypothetical protein
MPSLERVGVKVRRETSATTPQAIIPVLRAMAVGPCYEVLDLYDGSTLNTDALLSAPARLMGTVDVSTPTGLRNKTFKVSVNRGVTQTVTFPSNLTTKNNMLSVLSAGISGLSFSLADGMYLSMQTTSIGDNAYIEIKDGTSNADLGFSVNQTAAGAGTYKNNKLGISFSAFPAPRGNMAYLNFSSLDDEIHAYYKQSGTVREFSRTSAVLRSHQRYEYTKWLATTSEAPFEYGFTYLGAPTSVGTWFWSKSHATADTFGLGRAGLKSRALTAVDDLDGDAKTPRVASYGGTAFTNVTFQEAPYTYILLDTGTTGKSSECGMIKLVLDTTYLPSYVGEYVSYQAQRGLVAGIAVTGSGNVDEPWLISQTYTAGQDLTAVVGNFNASTVELPNSLAVSSTGENIQLKDAVTATVFANDATVMQDVSATYLDWSKYAEVTVTANINNNRHGAVGNNLLFAVAGSGADTFAYSGGSGDTPEALKTGTFNYTNPVACSGAETMDGDTFTMTVNDAFLRGTRGVLVTYESVAGADDLMFLAITRDADGEITDVKITQNFVSGVTTTNTAKANINNDQLLNKIVTISDCGGNHVTEVTIAVSGGSDVTPVSTAMSKVNAGDGGVIELLMTSASSSIVFDTDCPVSAVSATQLTGGWDPDDFLLYDSNTSSDWNHGTVIGATDLSGLAGGGADISGKQLLVRVCGGDVQTITFEAADDTPAKIVTKINGTGNSRWGVAVASLIQTNKYLCLDSKEMCTLLGNYGRKGIDSSIEIVGGNAVDVLFARQQRFTFTADSVVGAVLTQAGKDFTGLGAIAGDRVVLAQGTANEETMYISTAGTTTMTFTASPIKNQGGTPTYHVYCEDYTDYVGMYTGNALAVKEGDQLYNNGTLIGTVTGIEDLVVGTRTFDNAVLVMDGEVTKNTSYEGWYIRANSIDFDADNLGNKERPLPQLYVDAANEILFLKNSIAVDSTGVPTPSAACTMYVTYRALRTDLKNGVNISTEDSLDDVAPWDTRNPLGLALWCAWQVAGGTTVSGLGVDEVSEDEPDGTLNSYSNALAVLQALDGYTLVPLTNALPVLDLFDAHVDAMDLQKVKRIVAFCPEIPDRAQPTTGGTGTVSQDSVSTVTFDEGTLNVTAVMVDLGFTEANQTEEDLAEAGIYLDIDEDANHYLVKSFAGQSITVQLGSTYWEKHEGNEDGFYSTEAAIETVAIDGAQASIKQRGEELTTTEDIATSMGALANSYNSIRVRLIGPDEIELPINGLSSRVNGYYAAVIAAAQITITPPATPLTFQEIPLVTNVFNPTGMSDYEMGIAAYGGYCIAINDNGSVKWRDFVTTKNSPIEDFEHSMITPDDVAAYIFKTELTPFVGPQAIKKEYLNRIAMTCEIICRKLVDNDIYKECTLSSVEQDPTDPRQLNIAIDRGEYYPARQILVILV